MPSNLTIYDQVTMLAAVELLPPIPSFLFDTFVRLEGAVAQEEAIWDYRKGASRMAPFVHKLGGVLTERGAYSTNKIEFPTLAPMRVLEAKDTTNRLFGEDIWGGKTPEQRAKEVLMKDIQDLRKLLQLRREWMTAQILLEGKLPILEYTDDGRVTIPTTVVDYDFTNAYAASDAWDTADAEIQSDLSNIYAMVEAGLGTSEVIVMAPNVAAAIMNNTKFLQKLNLLHVNNGNLTTEHRMPGVTYYGTSPDGQEMYSYSGKVINEANQLVPLIPSGKLICGSRKMLRCIHGPINKIDKDGTDGQYRTFITNELPSRNADEKANIITQKMMSRPMIIPDNVGGWAVADVL